MRRCVAKDSDCEYAVKIVDKSQEETITESIAIEMQMLRALPHHKHISEFILKLCVIVGMRMLTVVVGRLSDSSVLNEC